MSDSGPGPDIVVVAIAAIVVVAVAGAAALATMRASVYADGTSHWHHMSHALVLAGGAIGLASAAVLFSARRVAAIRVGLATGSAGTFVLALSPLTYHTPG